MFIVSHLSAPSWSGSSYTKRIPLNYIPNSLDLYTRFFTCVPLVGMMNARRIMKAPTPIAVITCFFPWFLHSRLQCLFFHVLPLSWVYSVRSAPLSPKRLDNPRRQNHCTNNQQSVNHCAHTPILLFVLPNTRVLNAPFSARVVSLSFERGTHA